MAMNKTYLPPQESLERNGILSMRRISGLDGLLVELQ